MLTISQSAIAPESMRIDVKVAGSIAVCFSAMRHSSELPAKAIIANDVRIKTCVREITRETCGDVNVEKSRLQFYHCVANGFSSATLHTSRSRWRLAPRN